MDPNRSFSLQTAGRAQHDPDRGDVVPGLDADSGIDLKVCIDDDHVTHFARTYVMNAADANTDPRAAGRGGRALRQTVLWVFSIIEIAWQRVVNLTVGN